MTQTFATIYSEHNRVLLAHVFSLAHDWRRSMTREDISAVSSISDEVAMHEVMPVLLGLLIGMRHERSTMSRPVITALMLAAALLASASSGELTASPWWILADLALVATGAIAARAPGVLYRLRRRRQHESLVSN